MLAAATSFFSRTAINQSYNVGTPSHASRSSTPGTNGVSTASASSTPAFCVGLWKVQSGSHKVTNKRVSVWTFDKRGSEIEQLGPQAKERSIEVMKTEALALGRLRHPSILEMVEPLEETRTELIFATEPVLSSLALAIPDSGRSSFLVELDEIEIQKGILQLCKGLAFLHTSAKLIHSNLCPESVVINNAGDWKVSGLGLTIPLFTPNGSPSHWEFPTFDGRSPSYIQRSFDYMAPEYALDEQVVTSSDMYSLGCLVYAVHCKGSAPFKNHGSLGGLRDNCSKPLPGVERLDSDLQGLLRSLITRQPNSRPTPEALPSHPFFSSLPISTLNFLDRSNFTAKTREEKISFMKGLTGVLDKFSDGLRTRKILPSLVEEMKDINLLPYILPNVFSISNSLSPTQFATTVLPSLKPLFAIREPPQNMLTLLDNLTMLQDKTDKNVFREHVLPLVYNALDSEHAIVQERALKVVPGLCETIDFAEVQGVLFPRVALVFTKTRILTVKVATLATFLAMVKTLDQSSLTQKLVPLLSKIRTKEPAVMMSTLSVQEAMGFKVDREAVATLVLPQLWAMSMGPLLSVGQFQRFMEVIRNLGQRVEKEHDQFLRDSQRLEDRSTVATDDGTGANGTVNVDFESLVGRANGATIKVDAVMDANTSWNDDVWGSIFNSSVPAITPPLTSPVTQSQPMSLTPVQPISPAISSRPTYQVQSSKLTVTPMSMGTMNPPKSRRQDSITSDLQKQSTFSSELSHSVFPQNPFPPPPGVQLKSNMTHIQSKSPQSSVPSPNYNIYTSPLNHIPLASPFPGSNISPSLQQFSTVPSISPPAAMGGLLVPSKPANHSSVGMSSHVLSKDDWGDFDPLS